MISTGKSSGSLSVRQAGFLSVMRLDLRYLRFRRVTGGLLRFVEQVKLIQIVCSLDAPNCLCLQGGDGS
jgi:hypothetical protein